MSLHDLMIFLGLGTEAKMKLLAMSKMNGINTPDLACLILEGGIFDAWEGYRRNPKRRKQILEWEARNG